MTDLFTAAKQAALAVPAYTKTLEASVTGIRKCLCQQPGSKTEKRLKRTAVIARSGLLPLSAELDAYQMLEEYSGKGHEIDYAKETLVERAFFDQFLPYNQRTRTAKYINGMDIVNGIIKELINSGDVHTLMTHAAITAFERLRSWEGIPSTTLEHLRKTCKLELGGGVAIGKYLLDPRDPEVYDLFVKGGDNDAALIFSDPPNANPETVEAFKCLLHRQFMVIFRKVVEEFDILKLLWDKISVIHGRVIYLYGQRFVLSLDTRESFILDNGRRTVCRPKNYIYTTEDVLDFPTNIGRAHFRLGRLFVAVKVTDMYGRTARARGELFDLSTTLPGDDKVGVLEYSKIPVDRVLYN